MRSSSISGSISVFISFYCHEIGRSTCSGRTLVSRRNGHLLILGCKNNASPLCRFCCDLSITRKIKYQLLNLLSALICKRLSISEILWKLRLQTLESCWFVHCKIEKGYVLSQLEHIKRNFSGLRNVSLATLAATFLKPLKFLLISSNYYLISFLLDTSNLLWAWNS